MLRAGIAFLLCAYLPGALVYRFPILNRGRRAALAAEERAFWHVMLSVAWTLLAALALAAAGRYRYDWLLIGNAVICAAFVAIGRGRLRYGGTAARPDWRMVLPLIVVAIGLWRFFPTSEYVIGGKDPGTYINEGVQMAQRGGL